MHASRSALSVFAVFVASSAVGCSGEDTLAYEARSDPARAAEASVAPGATEEGAGDPATSDGGAGGSPDRELGPAAFAWGGASGTSGSLAPPASALVESCTSFWNARCEEWAACFPLEEAAVFGDVAACARSEAERCERTTIGPGSIVSPAQIAACFASFGPLACHALRRFLFEQGGNPTCAGPAGKSLAGSPCVASSECATRFCEVVPPRTSGVCALEPKEGDPCHADAECGAMRCADGACAPYLDAGEACDGGGCHVDLACRDGVCADRLPVGAACDSKEAACVPGAWCDPGTRRCVAIALAHPGDSCPTCTPPH